MSKGYPFPNVARLQEALAVRGWTREELAQHAGVHVTVAYKAVAGKPVAIASIEAISRAINEHQPDTAAATFLSGEGAA